MKNVKRFQQKSSKGFTIIEVLIVLAIAGLILAIVFLAVPALQRGQRNNARKQEASRVAASIVDYGSNTGTAGAQAKTQAACVSVITNTTNLAQYAFTSSSCQTEGTSLPTIDATSNGKVYVDNGGVGTAGTPAGATDKIMIIANDVQCSGTNAVTASSGKTALLYSLEATSNAAWACLNVQ